MPHPFLRVFLALRKARRVPFVALYSQLPSGFRFSENFKVAKYKGLLCCHVLEDPATRARQLESIWKSQDFFREQGYVLAADCELSHPPEERRLRELQLPRKAVLKRLPKISELLVKLFALLGAVTALQPILNGLAGKPDVLLEGVNDQREMVVGETLATDFGIREISGAGVTRVRLESAEVKDSHGRSSKAIDIENNAPSWLAPVEPYKVGLKQLKLRALTAGEYTLDVTGVAKMGRLRDGETLVARIPVHIYPHFAIVKCESITPTPLANATQCRVRFSAEVGDAAESLRCHAILLANPNLAQLRGVEHVSVQYSANSPIPREMNDHQTVSKIEWTFLKLQPRSRLFFTLILEAPKPVAPERWHELASQLRFPNGYDNRESEKSP